MIPTFDELQELVDQKTVNQNMKDAKKEVTEEMKKFITLAEKKEEELKKNINQRQKVPIAKETAICNF